LLEKFFRGRRKISQTAQQKKAHLPPSSILGSQKRSHTDLKDLFEIFLRAQKNFSNGSAEKSSPLPSENNHSEKFLNQIGKKKGRPPLVIRVTHPPSLPTCVKLHDETQFKGRSITRFHHTV